MKPFMMFTKIVAGSCWSRIKHVRAMCGPSALCLLTFAFPIANIFMSRFQRPRGLRPGFAATRLLRLWFRIPPGEWMSVCCEYFVLSGRGLCEERITRAAESCQLCCVVVCDLETSRIRRPMTPLGTRHHRKKYTFKKKISRSTTFSTNYLQIPQIFIDGVISSMALVCK
jgi:hypothetical protein